MAINIVNEKIRSNNIDLDANYGPYESVSEAHSNLLDNNKNKVGVTVGIKNNTTQTIEEYWYQGGTTESYLVKKQVASIEVDSELSSTSENPVQNKVVKLALDTKGTYSIPSGGIPKTDLASSVQASLGNADTALQPLQSGQYTENNFAAFYANGGIKDSQKKASDFATAEQGAKADTALQSITVGTTTTGNAGTNASVVNSGTSTAPVFDFTIPRGQDGADAVNPFNGWWPDLATLKAAVTAVPGDYAYIMPAVNTDPVAIYKYDSTATTDNYWADSGRTFNPANNQEFASGEDLNTVNIVDHVNSINPKDVLSAKQGKILNDKIDNFDIITTSIEKSQSNYIANQSISYINNEIVINNSDNGYIVNNDKIVIESGTTYKVYSGFIAQQSDYNRCLILFNADDSFRVQRKFYTGDSYTAGLMYTGPSYAGCYIKSTFYLGEGHGDVKITKIVDGVETIIWEPTDAQYKKYIDSESVIDNETERTVKEDINGLSNNIEEINDNLDSLEENLESILQLNDAIYIKEITTPANYLDNKRIWYDATEQVIKIEDEQGYIVSDFIPVEPGVTYKWYSGFSTNHKNTDTIPAQLIEYKGDKTYRYFRNAYNVSNSQWVEEISVTNTTSFIRATFQPNNQSYDIKFTKVVDGVETTVWEPQPASTIQETYIDESKVINKDTEVTLDTELAALKSSISETSVGHKLFLGKFANIQPKINGNDVQSDNYVCMSSSILVPYRGIKLKFNIPNGILAGVKCGNSGSVPASSSGEYVVNNYNNIKNGDTLTLANEDALYRIYFYKEDNTQLDVEDIEDYIDNGVLNITYDNFGSSVIEDNQENEKLIKSILYKVNNSVGNNYLSNIPVFAHISDIHGDAERLERCMQYCDYLGVDACLVSGDQVNFNPSTGYDFVDYIASKHNTPMYLCLGNHDTFGSSLEQKYSQLAYCIETNEITVPSGVTYPTYYYKDIQDVAIRLIVLDQWYVYNSIYYGQDQIDWFIDTLSSTPNGYSVLVMLHAPESKPTPISGNDKFYLSTLFGGSSYVYFSTGGCPIKDIIDAFISRTSLSKSYAAGGAYSGTTFNINADFSAIDSSIEFIAQVSGHEHADIIGKVADSTQNQIMLNITTGASIYGLGITNASWAGYDDLPRGGKGSVQDAFNLYAIDKVNGVIRIVRVGSNIASPIGTSNDFVVRDYIVLPYIQRNQQ